MTGKTGVRAGRGAGIRWRPQAGTLVTLMAVAFGMTVVLTRLYLMASGYPKIGGGTYHIAHALFGGLLLVIACLLLLISFGRPAMVWAALLAGVGLGLFIDEVGKFITANNDYFFPLAAPIIYLVFLMTVVVARYSARHRIRSSQAMLAALATEVGQTLGHLSNRRRQQLRDHAERVDRAGCTWQQLQLLEALDRYLSEAVADTSATLAGRLATIGIRWESQLLPLPVLRAVLITVMIAHALWSLLRLALAVVVGAGWHSRWHQLDRMLDISNGHGWKSMVGLTIAATAEIVVGLGFGVGAVAWLRGHPNLGVRLGIWASVVSLTVVNVMASYFSQFLTVFTALAEALLLWLLLRYRTRRTQIMDRPDPRWFRLAGHE